MAKKDQVNAAYNLITGGKQGKAGSGKPAPVGVALTAEELVDLQTIASNEGVSRHAVLQYAVRDFIMRYAKGERPRIETRTITTLRAGD
jgi:hypothetical protein